MKIALLIGIGGFIGSIARYLVHISLTKFIPVIFPWGTLSVNLVGCFILGIIIGASEGQRPISEEWRFFLGVGFCGSFTTYSTFAFEGFSLLFEKNYILFTTYFLASLILGLLLAAIGYFLFSR